MIPRLFNAYNQCDIPTLSSLVSDDLEFYIDKTGLSVATRPRSFRTPNNTSSAKFSAPSSLLRWRSSRLEVYRAPWRWAFTAFIIPTSPQDYVAGEAKFVMLWQNTNATWKLTSVISYDHESLAK